MRITKLSVTGLRALKQVDFEFQPGMNLLVGVNGVGKTTILDALCVSISRILPNISSSNSPKQTFYVSDITNGTKSLMISCDFVLNSIKCNLLLKKNIDSIIVKVRESEDIDKTKKKKVREEFKEMEDIEQFSNSFNNVIQESKDSKTQPLAVYFSTKRSFFVDQKVSNTSIVGGKGAAFAESLSGNREFNLRIIAQWFNVQEEIGKESPLAFKHISVLKNAIERFLPEFNNLHVVDLDGIPQLRIEKNGTIFDLKQLSDGERGILSIVFDIARRLSQANPELADPLTDGRAIVLIDELDLHLHPKWQRTIVENLTRTFPNCQFIATTHSPQIIPSVEPEQVILLKDNEVILPDRTKGMDSNWILKFLMDSEDRPQEAIDAIAKIEVLIKQNKFNEARAYIADYRTKNLDLTEWSMFEARIARLEVFNKSK